MISESSVVKAPAKFKQRIKISLAFGHIFGFETVRKMKSYFPSMQNLFDWKIWNIKLSYFWEQWSK